jgi:hypothetical protein
MIILGPAAVDGGGRLDPQTAIFGLLADAVDDDVGDIEGDGAGASIAQISIAKPGISIAASVKCRGLRPSSETRDLSDSFGFVLSDGC